MDVKATDLGNPKLSTSISLSIFIRHVATVAPDVGVGFAEDSYTVQVPENSPSNTLIKTFTVVNNRMLINRGMPLKCTIVSGNSESEYREFASLSFSECKYSGKGTRNFLDIFYTNVTAEKNCELRVKDAKLDHEHEREFVLKIRLDTFAGLVNPEKSESTVSSSSFKLNTDRTATFIY